MNGNKNQFQSSDKLNKIKIIAVQTIMANDWSCCSHVSS